MHIALGQTVVSRDGHKIGTIDRVIVNPSSNHVERFIVHRGFLLDDDKIVDRAVVEGVNDDRVHLSIDAVEVRQLPQFEPSFSAGETDPGYLEIGGGSYQSMILLSTPPLGPMYFELGAHIHLDPLDPLPGHDETAAREGDVVIGKGAAVFGSDGNRVGHVHELEYGENGELSTLVVQNGMLRHHSYTISAMLIAEIGDEEVILRIPAGDAGKSRP